MMERIDRLVALVPAYQNRTEFVLTALERLYNEWEGREFVVSLDDGEIYRKAPGAPFPTLAELKKRHARP
jgi:hypothetical protein